MAAMNIKTKVVGVDIGVERTTYAIVDIRGTIIAKDSFLTSDYPDLNEFVSVLSEKIIDLVERNGGYETVRSVGISSPSANFLTGCIENAANLPWKGVVPLAAMMRDRLGIAVAVANDAHITALAENTFGCAHGMKDFIHVSFSHGGIGSCIFSKGEAHLGADGFAGEFGHTCIEDGGRQCTCGRRGCLEEYISARGVVQTARELLAESDEPSLMRGRDDLTAEDILDCCNQGDSLAIEVYRRAGETFGIALANYVTTINPEAVVLTGDIVRVGDWMLEPARKALKEHMFHNIQGEVKVIVSFLPEGERDVLGASALAWNVKEYSLFK